MAEMYTHSTSKEGGKGTGSNEPEDNDTKNLLKVDENKEETKGKGKATKKWLYILKSVISYYYLNMV